MAENFIDNILSKNDGKITLGVGKITLTDVGLCTVSVHTSEEDCEPFMHIESEDGSFSTDVCILDPVYHGEVTLFTETQRAEFNTWCHDDAQRAKSTNISYWARAFYCWAFANQKNKANKIKSAVDYLTLPIK